MCLDHEAFPHRAGPGRAERARGHRRIVSVAHPHAGGQVRGVAHDHSITEFLAGTRLGRRRAVGQGQAAPVDRLVRKNMRHHVGIRGVNHLLGLRLSVLVDDVPQRILDL